MLPSMQRARELIKDARMQMSADTIYTSVFTLLRFHSDHIARVVFTALNVWWLVTFALPVIFGTVVAMHMSFYVGAGAIVAVVFVDFLLMLMRENAKLINAHYMLTMSILFNFIVIEFISDSIELIQIGPMFALAALATASYMQYGVKIVHRLGNTTYPTAPPTSGRK